MALRIPAVFFGMAMLMSFANAQSGGAAPTIRGVRIETVGTSSTEFPATPLDVVTKTGVALETQLSVIGIEKAKGAIAAHYSQLGRKVRVDHEVTSLPPGSVEVKFRVTELCNC